MSGMKEILCKTCAHWVDCTKGGKADGFCLNEPLFTHTARTRCPDYTRGTPMTEDEYENYNGGGAA